MKLLPLLFLLEALLLQWLGGAYASGFGGHPDEAAHFVSSLMVHDFLGRIGDVSPLAFAQQFYLYYPKVAIGNWPPLLHLLLALWYLLFGVSRASALGFVAVCAAGIATLIAATAHRLLSPAAALFAGALYLALPLVQESSSVVMTEHLVTLLMLAASLAFARFVRNPGTASALLFGALCAAAILTRGSAWALLLVPPFVIAATRDWRLLRAWRLWLAALPVVALCVPWYLGARGMANNAMVGIDPGAPAAFFLHGLRYFPLAAAQGLGMVLSALAAVGIWRRLLRQPAPEWVALAGLALGVLLIQCVVPAGFEPRYMLQLLPALMLFAAAGVHELRTPRASVAVWSAAALLVLLTVFRLPLNLRNSGYEPLAAALHASAAGHALLLISDARGEGSMIAAIALRERRPHTLVLRGSKLLVSEDWLGRASQPRYASAPDLRAMLDAIPVQALVIDHAIADEQRRSYHRDIEQLLKAHPEDWQLQASYDITRYGELLPRAADVYLRRNGAASPNLATIGRLLQRH